jgi:hypothetical protein
MKHLILTVVAFVAMTSASFGIVTDVTLDYVQNPDPAVGLKSYTIRATGVGINTLGKFTISGDVYQVWTAPNTQSEWLHNPDGHTPGNVKDSYAIFGDMRMPDMPGYPPQTPPILPTTMETIHNGGIEGLGTLNNYNPTTGAADAYLVLGTPVNWEETYDLLKVVVPANNSVTVGLDIYTVERNPETGYYDHVTQYSFFGANALHVVPEPTTLVALAVGAFCMVLRRVR